MTQVERFQSSKHLATVQRWYASRGWPELAQDEIPPLGWITESCACWAYLTGTSIAYVENLISDPDAHPRSVLRSMRALDPVVRAALREYGVKRFFTYTFSPLCYHFWSGVEGAEMHRKPFTMYRVKV